MTNSALKDVDFQAHPVLRLIETAETGGVITPEHAKNLQYAHAIGVLPEERIPDALVRAMGGIAGEKALAAIERLFAPDDVIELRAIDPAGGGATSLCGRLSEPSERAALADFVRHHNGKWNLYVGVNPRAASMAGQDRAGSEADVPLRRNVVIDLDLKDAPPNDPQWARTRAELSALNPAMVTNTGNGWHFWFPVADGDADPAGGPVLAAAMARLGADNMADLPRIARLPGTVNLPTDAKRTRGNVTQLATAERPAGAADVDGAASRALQTLSADLVGIADRLALPGKNAAPATGSASRVGANGERKTGQPAPSADLLRMLLAELPNHMGGPFDARDRWAAIGHAVKGAAVAGGCEAEGREAWLKWSAKWGGDPAKAEEFWDTCRDTHTGWGTLMRELERVNPQGARWVQGAAARHAFAQQAVTNHAAIAGKRLVPAGGIAAGAIPPREWLYGTTLIARNIAILSAPGGQGKSALALIEAVAMATGKELLLGEKPHRKLRVLYHNAEDDADELNRRFAAILQHHGLTDADLGGRLFMTSGRDVQITLARQGREGPELVPGAVEGLIDLIRDNKIDVLVLDPLGAMHTLPENDNAAMNVLLGGLREIAHKTGVAIMLLHHTSKAAAADMDAAGAGAVRGASALVDGARIVRQLVRMTPKEAERFGIPPKERWNHFRVENGKANLAPAADARWCHMANVPLNNCTPAYPLGDRVGVVERWTPPTAANGSAADLAAVQAALAGLGPDQRRASLASDGWVGYAIADALGMDIGQPKQKAETRTPEQAFDLALVKGLIRDWLAGGGLVRKDARDDRQGRPVKVIAVGKPAVVADDGRTDCQTGEAAEITLEKMAGNILEFPAQGGALAQPQSDELRKKLRKTEETEENIRGGEEAPSVAGASPPQ